MALPILPVVALALAGTNLIVNPGFDQGLDGWQNAHGAGIQIEAAVVDGRTTGHISVPLDSAVGWPALFQTTAAAPGDVFEATAQGMGREVRDGFGVYIAVEFFDAGNTRITFAQSDHVWYADTWQALHVRTAAPPGTARAKLDLLLNGHGHAYFDDAEFTRTPTNVQPPDELVTLAVTDEVICDSLIGFGAEDDGWFYSPVNAEHGVTEEDYALRESRIEWMDPDWVRMFMWYTDWCPSGDWQTFTFETPNMQSHYRTLDLYQRIGARVNIVGVEWAIARPYDNPEQLAYALGELFEYLIGAKGYTCVRDWTPMNEPNLSFVPWGYTIADYVRFEQLVKAEFDRRGLKVKVVTSDEANDVTWFELCATNEEGFAAADLFASHRYAPPTDMPLASHWYRERLDLLAARSPAKPLVIAEFGFTDERTSTFANPIIESYPYAVWTSAFIIEGLNQGVAGFSIWCLHEVWYPVGTEIMNFGLWNYKDRGWQVRPVYYAMAHFMRHTEPGDVVRRCLSTDPGSVSGAVVGDTLFWVNQSDRPVPIRLSGFSARTVRVMTQSSLHGDRECGTVVRLRGGRFTAPPMSFGYAVSLHRGTGRRDPGAPPPPQSVRGAGR